MTASTSGSSVASMVADSSIEETASRIYNGGYRGTQHQLLNALALAHGSRTDQIVKSAAAEEIERLNTEIEALKHDLQVCYDGWTRGANQDAE